ncbi:MAG TPA: aspartate aminotransferase family protein, partial [Bauldia sp.]|nr:aspartate aminotransferase family protein [Bauldia sp.]
MKPQLKANSPHARDLAYSLHPYTNARQHEARGPVIIDRGTGIRVYDDQGKEYIEALAGLWSVAIGYGEERLVQAAADQMRKLPYYHSFSGKANQPSIDLAEKLVAMTPGRLTRAFFANSGSEANDSIVKMVWYYNNAIGRPQKKKIISRIRGYHGITVASGSLTGLPWNHRDFDLPIANIRHTGCPHHYRFGLEGESEEEFASRLAGQFEQLILAEGPDTVAAFIGEPVMGAGGVIVPPRTYWQKMQAICRKYDILVIADEVITGFGRTGTPFACERFGIDPDFLVLSKQITSSYLPLSAILFTDAIYQGIADNSAKIGTFGHGFTASGHPVATAVALENIRIIEERKLFAHSAAMGEYLQTKLRAAFSDHPLVGEVRGVGLIAALEMVADKKTKRQFDPLGKVGAYFFDRSHHHG